MLGWPARMSGSTVPIEAAPLLGAHTDEVLAAELQLSPEAARRAADLRRRRLRR